MKDFDTGSRVLYIERSGRTRTGTVREQAGKFVDIELDGMTSKRTFFVPVDTLQPLPPELDEKEVP